MAAIVAVQAGGLMTTGRLDRKAGWLGMAKVASMMGTCRRRNYGAVVVVEDVLASSGYTGAPRGMPHCLDLGECYRVKHNVPSGEHYDMCRSVHAEMNVIINAARVGDHLLGGTLYLYVPEGGIDKPCRLCARMLINVGIVCVVTEKSEYTIDDLRGFAETE